MNDLMRVPKTDTPAVPGVRADQKTIWGLNLTWYDGVSESPLFVFLSADFNAGWAWRLEPSSSKSHSRQAVSVRKVCVGFQVLHNALG